MEGWAFSDEVVSHSGRVRWQSGHSVTDDYHLCSLHLTPAWLRGDLPCVGAGWTSLQWHACITAPAVWRMRCWTLSLFYLLPLYVSAKYVEITGLLPALRCHKHRIWWQMRTVTTVAATTSVAFYRSLPHKLQAATAVYCLRQRNEHNVQSYGNDKTIAKQVEVTN